MPVFYSLEPALAYNQLRMFNLLGKLFDTNTKEVEKLLVLVKQINGHEAWARNLKDKEFRSRSKSSKMTYETGRTSTISSPKFLLLPARPPSGP